MQKPREKANTIKIEYYDNTALLEPPVPLPLRVSELDTPPNSTPLPNYV